VLGYGLYTASTGGEEDKAAAPAASKLDMDAGSRGDSLEEKSRGDFKKVIDGQQLLGDRITAIEEGKVVPHGAMPSGDAAGADSGDSPPASPGSAPAFPPSPGGAPGGVDTESPSPPVPPAPPAAPPAPPVEKVIGSIGGATSKGKIVKDGMGSSISSIGTKIAVAKGVFTGMSAAYAAFKAGATAGQAANAAASAMIAGIDPTSLAISLAINFMIDFSSSGCDQQDMETAGTAPVPAAK
ncbi:hypothetical protein OY671_008019, partial [Metschnikowia pulcherrima]